MLISTNNNSVEECLKVAKDRFFFSILFVVTIFCVLTFLTQNIVLVAQAEEIYNPEISPANFSTIIDNPFFTLPVGKKMVFEGETEAGLERIEIEITADTKVIMDVITRVYRDKVWLNGELIEDTRDYLAEDSEGNVWYFGEHVDNYVDGVVANHDGTWIAGVDGAKPGIWMLANPKVGDVYREEYYKGRAEDMAKVLSVSESVEVPYGSFENCLKTLNYTLLEPDVEEHKYYCKGAKGLVLEIKPADDERIELLEVTMDVEKQYIRLQEHYIALLKVLISILSKQIGV